MTVSLSTVEDKTRATIGVRLFTVLAWVPERRALRRVYSSHPVEYPVGGEKTVEVAAGWLERCITGQEPYFGPDSAAVREIFADHELIDSLGCGAVINVRWWTTAARSASSTSSTRRATTTTSPSRPPDPWHRWPSRPCASSWRRPDERIAAAA